MHLMIGRSATTVAFAFLILAAPASAASCSVSPQQLSLGRYDPFASAPQDAVTSIAISCDVETSVVIAIGPGNGDYGARSMTGGAQALLYNLYIDPAHSRVWGDGTNGSSTVSSTAVATSTAIPVYARAPARQTQLKPGSYSDILWVSITY
ncbi:MULTISPECIES: Csu type fimbrial protein [unclassified Sphingomonas]|uniref:Csu type fimbrial protein n=1 Tax=unclassified Sphingomonas TaxID=196159 RepID=UPI0009EA2A6B|nr:MULTISPECIES: spore coat U domain-containing protein [unclassified Sphingomonas]MBD8551174.1 spore coat protein U domain-containing protein [Sphingomonas sp. CFBP 8764]